MKHPLRPWLTAGDPVTVVAGKGTEELPSCGARGAWGEGREGGGGATYRKNCPEAVARRSVL